MILGFDLRYRYANGVELFYRNSGPQRGSNGPRAIRGDRRLGLRWYGPDRLEAEPKSILTAEVKPEEFPFTLENEKRNFLNCVKTRARTLEDAEVGHRSSSVAQLGYIACQVGRKLKWDPAAERFAGDDEANRLLCLPPGRAPVEREARLNRAVTPRESLSRAGSRRPIICRSNARPVEPAPLRYVSCPAPLPTGGIHEKPIEYARESACAADLGTSRSGSGAPDRCEARGDLRQAAAACSDPGMVDGPLLGNGDVGVVLAGPPEAQQFHLGKNDFWRRHDASIMAVGSIRLDVPALAGASYHQEQDMAHGEVRGPFPKTC